MTPLVNDERLFFEASGLYDGLVLLGDTKTRSYWNHITGECLHGHYLGAQLEVNNLLHYSLERALDEFPDLLFAISKMSLIYRIIASIAGDQMMRSKGFIPPHFRSTMAHGDDRLDENELGLGVVIDGKAKFYNVDIIMSDKIVDVFQGRNLEIWLDSSTRTPRCIVKGSDEIPLQLYTRWFGFSLSYKSCDIYRK